MRNDLPLGTVRQAAQLFFFTWLLVVGWSAVTQAADPGDAYPDAAEASDQKRGSVLFFNFFSSNATNPALENSEVSLTNLNPIEGTAVHLFLVDGTTGTINQRFMYLNPAQTSTLSLFDVAPGKRGYVVAVAIDGITGCPRKFNDLVGTADIKLASGHSGSLPAVAVAALANTPAACGGVSTTLNFDGTSYNRLPRLLSLNNLPSRLDGNDTFLILNRVGGDFTGSGAATVAGSVGGLLWDDAGNGVSFTLLSGLTVPQLAFSITEASVQTVPRLNIMIPASRSGWLRLNNTNTDAAYLGASLNYHPNAATQLGSYDHGHNLTALTNTVGSSAITIPLSTPDIAVLMTNSGNFVRGGTASYGITVYNSGTFPMDGALVTDLLPVGQTLASFAGGGWNCASTLSFNRTEVRCESSALLLGGGSLPLLSLTVNIAANAVRGETDNVAQVTHPIDINPANNIATNTINILPPCPVVTLTPTTLPDAKQGVAYAQTLTANGGVPPYRFSIVGGTVLPDLILQQNGTLSGVPTQPGIYSFVVQADDSDQCGVLRTYILRIAPSHTVPSDYDGDGFVDLTVWRGAQGQWRTLKSGNGAEQATLWGAGFAPYNDVPVPADYDGNGKTELAVFRRADSKWYIRNADGSFWISSWGDGTDTPVPADYDGDGVADLAVWRGSTGVWYIRRSSDGLTGGATWGSANAPYHDIPVVADYDGDGKADIAVFRPNTGEWLIINSSTGQFRVVKWGQAGDTPVPGDYDGDGKLDLAIWRGASGLWLIQPSSNGQSTSVLWGTSAAPYNDIAVPGDYDSDGYADLAVWRPANGTWYIRNGRTGAYIIQAHGQAGEMPLPPR